MTSRFAGAALVGACLVALLTGCATGPGAAPTPTPTAMSEEEAFAAAEATYRAYVDALNQVDLSDPATFEEVYRWTTGDALATEKKSLTGMHAKGWTVSGESHITLMQASREQDGPRSIDIDACVDVSTIALVDSGGNSVVGSDRGNTQSVRVSLASSANSGTGWLVSFVNGREGDPTCE